MGAGFISRMYLEETTKLGLSHFQKQYPSGNIHSTIDVHPISSPSIDQPNTCLNIPNIENMERRKLEKLERYYKHWINKFCPEELSMNELNTTIVLTMLQRAIIHQGFMHTKYLNASRRLFREIR